LSSRPQIEGRLRVVAVAAHFSRREPVRCSLFAHSHGPKNAMQVTTIVRGYRLCRYRIASVASVFRQVLVLTFRFTRAPSVRTRFLALRVFPVAIPGVLAL
jgi:hypothetical protein